jgi:hypothetical protein
MYKGLCLGYDDYNTVPPLSREIKRLVHFRPCSEGHTLWQLTPEGYLKPPHCNMFAASPCGYAIITAAVSGVEYIMLYNTYAPSTVAVMGDLRNRGYFAFKTSNGQNPHTSGSPGELRALLQQLLHLALSCKQHLSPG